MQCIQCIHWQNYERCWSILQNDAFYIHSERRAEDCKIYFIQMIGGCSSEIPLDTGRVTKSADDIEEVE